jgi:uncharacterized protein YqhQ
LEIIRQNQSPHDEDKRKNKNTKNSSEKNKIKEIVLFFVHLWNLQHLIKIILFTDIEIFLANEFEIFFWENEIFEGFFKIDSILASFCEEEIFIRVRCEECADIFSRHS